MTATTLRAARVLLDGTLRPADLVLCDGRIARIGDPGDTPEGEIIDVPDDAMVLPGVVDTHVHVNEPGRTTWEGFASATRAAARGGVTTIIDMPLNAIPPTVSVAALDTKRAAAEGQRAVNTGFWGGAVPDNLGTLEGLWEAGVFGFKCFLSPSGVDEFPALDAAEFTRAMAEIARFDGLMIVHAEDAAVLDAAPARPSRAYADFLVSRPDDAEITAIRRVIQQVRRTGTRAHLLHLSSARALDEIAAARDEGLPLTVETCPHYLVFTAEDIPDGAPEFKCCPPIRDAGNREALWEALGSGLIDMIVSDHSPSTAEEKQRGDGDYQRAWGGISGLQVGFAAVADAAQARGYGIEHVSRWMSTATADLIGLSAKGRIVPGADADLLVYDPATRWRVTAGELAHKNPISAYDGRELTGSVTTAFVGGRSVDQPLPALDTGRELRRAVAAEAR
ncbi:allantoinase [Aeromicrobium sp. PE09-221]|uniref:allantoinase AllB n=1 Tax=Aeromicrobium sp. PE09-221 TaxID=1898043 RepID=UPI000B3E7BF7|nr:allantoinase AllB [Aeromicrobium sp. PE09-221]OUZ07069.1 allantoinase [Aeromicrobium sp. PE09-221]